MEEETVVREKNVLDRLTEIAENKRKEVREKELNHLDFMFLEYDLKDILNSNNDENLIREKLIDIYCRGFIVGRDKEKARKVYG